ncbi:MAG TPA: ATP-binding protein, partial [Terriglobales bacterium]|nr:ATP-binding protein [Terriglobales bacterium]
MRFRLKTKLVLAISGMVMAVVATFSTIYISRTVRQALENADADADFVGHQVFQLTRDALEVDLSNSRIDFDDPEAMRPVLQEALGSYPGLTTLLQSVIGYSPTIYDVSIVDADGHALLRTDGGELGTIIPQREELISVVHGSFRRQMDVVFGGPRVYELRIPLERDKRPFGAIRIGVSTTFLKDTLRQQLRASVVFSLLAIVVSLALAASLSNLALKPLEAINRRLDLLSAGQEPSGKERQRSDEYGVVTTKIDRLGRQMRDVKEVFSALKENLDQIMANLQDGVMLFTRDSRAVLVSASVEGFVGKPRGEMLGHGVTEIFGDDSRLGRLVLAYFERHQPLSGREVVSEGGTRVQVSLDFIEERGERIGALLTLHDAESVRRIEDEIELSRRLAAIGRLTSGVAHEVKNPINAIVVHLEVLRQKLQQLDPDTRRHIDVIGSEIQRLDRVVQTLVDFTRPVELRLADLDLRRLVDEVVVLAQPDAERHGVSIVRDFPPESLPVKVDADLVKQAVLNIVLNGVQAMPGGGELTLVGSRADDDAQLEVRDQGTGIPQEVRDKIFNLYFTTTKNGSGSGLAMAYRVMQLHNGSVEYDSVEAQGTTFRLRFPLSTAEVEAAQEVAARPLG